MPARRRPRPRHRPRAIAAFVAVALAIAGVLTAFFAVAPSAETLRSTAQATTTAPVQGQRPARAHAIDVEQERADRSGSPSTEVARLGARGKAPLAGGFEGELCSLSAGRDLRTRDRLAASEASKGRAPPTEASAPRSFECERARARGPPLFA